MKSKKRHNDPMGSGVAVEATPMIPTEPIHRGLARGALLKAAKAFKEGEIHPGEFNKHIKTAHSRLQEPMSTPPIPTGKSSRQRLTHRPTRRSKGSN